MAKQTFTTGQVLTAAQMTDLQQTAMGGGSPNIKTASYVLTAADAGTVIQMNSASSTTITVNTALFAAGDSVQIQNIGAGTCTITAGTATVTTAGSLALTQWEGGNLYFTSTSASIFFDFVQAASGGMTLLSTTSLSGATTTISSIDQTYKRLYGVIYGVTNATANGSFALRCNGSTTEHIQVRYTASAVAGVTANVFFLMANSTGLVTRTDANNAWTFTIDNYASASAYKPMTSYGLYNSGALQAWAAGGYFANTAITSLVFANDGGNLSTGTVLLYGVN